MSEAKSNNVLRLGLPKGHMKDSVLKLFAEAGIHVTASERGYRPTINLADVHVKLLKPQNILEMLHFGSRDIGFGGCDWVENLGVDVVELLDTEMDPVRIVAAAPDENILANARATGRTLVIASEYEKLTKDWIAKQGIKATFVRAFGATESFPPEDADMIVDNTATGDTLKANGLKIIDTLLSSSTRLYANKAALADPWKKERIDELILNLTSVLRARKHRMVEFNVDSKSYDAVVAQVPYLRAPTVAKLHADLGFAIKIAVANKALPDLLPRLRRLGATDIVVTEIKQLVA